MTLIPMKINDGLPRNSIGQLISIHNKYSEGIFASPCSHHYGIAGVKPYVAECKECQRTLRSRHRWMDYLNKELRTI